MFAYISKIVKISNLHVIGVIRKDDKESFNVLTVKKKGSKIDRTKHLILESGHPSPLSANRGYWFGNKHFIKTNDYLKSKGITEIEW